MSTAAQTRAQRDARMRAAIDAISGAGLTRIREHVIELHAETEHTAARAVDPREPLRRMTESLDDLAGYIDHLRDTARRALA